MSTTVKVSPQTSRTPAVKPSRWHVRRRALGPYLFLLPALLFLAIFLLYPIITMLLFSFEQVNVGSLLTGIMPFVGLDNYHTALADPTFIQSVSTSLTFTVACLVFQFTIGFLLALLFQQRLPLVGDACPGHDCLDVAYRGQWHHL
ncbi:hypothetical protein [Dictyobacter kobayashii]|uniref:ABC transmembrane type-1 domain-containing protein n=1 Tax=Dictyobacter kobayashii TaxID=2014872 RepID=A0A402ATJ6_9CHLR|nr:hypothetical protein [Dictyobacter kobayashii]GCE22414.1 hypothetical protein KDK_62140 [Dictyobacter kobayashii]